VRRILMIAAIVTVSLSITITAYAVVRQIIDRAESGTGYTYVASDEHFIEYPDEAWLDFNSGVIISESDDGSILEIHDDRYIEVKGVNLDEAYDYIGSEFIIPEGFGLTVNEVILLDDLYLGSRQVTVDMKSNYGSRIITTGDNAQSYSGAYISYNISTTIDDEDFQITVGMPGTIEELDINGFMVYRMIVSGESLGIENYPYNFIWMMWQLDGFAYRIFTNDITWTTEDLETLVTSVLSNGS